MDQLHVPRRELDVLAGPQGQGQRQTLGPLLDERLHQPEAAEILLAVALVLGRLLRGLQRRPAGTGVHHVVVEDDADILPPGAAAGRLVAGLQPHHRLHLRDQLVEDLVGQEVVAEEAGEDVHVVGIEPRLAVLVVVAEGLPALGHGHRGPFVQIVLQLPGQRVAVAAVDVVGAIGDLQFLALGHAERLLQGMHAMVDPLLVGQ